jgi:putative endonuclease
MTRNRDGLAWETQAGRYLHARGLRVVEARYRCRFGDIDLVCADGDSLVMVEVRARRQGGLVTAAESIDAAKRRKLILAARHLLATHPQWSDRPLRFDVVAIDGIDTPSPHFDWIRNAFEAG